MENSKILNWGLLGYGAIAREKMQPALESYPGARIFGVASGSRNIEDLDVPFKTTSYAALLENPSIDVIYISLPNSLHVEWVKKSLKAGKHVLCEKPMALSHEDAVEIQELAKSFGRCVLEGFMYRYTEKTRTLLACIESGEIGKVVSARSNFYSLRERATGIRIDKKLGGGSLLDLGSYPVNLFGMLKPGVPSVIQAVGKSFNSVDLYLSANLYYEDGTLFSFSCGWINDMREMDTVIIGTKGRIRVTNMFNGDEGDIEILTSDSQRTIHILPEDPFKQEVAIFTDWILHGVAPAYSDSEIYDTAQILEQLRNEMVLV